MGIATGAGSKIYTGSDGTSYTSFYIRLVTIDGNTIEYKVPFDSASFVGKAVGVTFDGPAINISGLTRDSEISGKVSFADMKIGATKMADGIRILDTDDNGNVAVIYPQRLDGVLLDRNKVLYSSKDGTGAVTQLILQNVTGDTASYGVLLRFSISDKDLYTSGTYSYNIGGNLGSFVSSTIFNVSVGPACFKMKNGSIISISSLQSLSDFKLSGYNAVVTGSGKKFVLWDKGSVFQLMSDGTYKLTTLTAVSGMSLTAYYDKNENEGGLIRVIIAQ